MNKLYLTLLLVAATAASALAIPACPEPCVVTQPDGTQFTLCLVGDEFLHFNTTVDGYSVVKDAAGYYVYAQKQDGELVATSVIARDPASRSESDNQYLSGIEKYIAPDMSDEASELRSSLKSMTSARPKLHGYGDIDLDKFRGLVILVYFNDLEFCRDDALEIFTNMVCEKDYAGVPSATDSTSIIEYGGSVRDYYYENSAGQFDPTFDVVGPVKIDYSVLDANGTSKGSTFAKAACRAADSLVDFSNYDTDGDGTVDMVYFIYAGNGSNYTGNDSGYIWPHASSMSNLTLDGVKLSRYACSVELYGTTSSTLDGIGTICHEFSHVLGLDDLYDTDYASSGGTSVHPGYWSVMASASYLNYGRTPAGYSLYERYALGFTTPEVINESGSYTVTPLQDSNAGYRIDSGTANEFFLLEDRKKEGWDAYLPGAGMLVWRVDSTDTDVWEDNDVNVNPDHNYYELLRAVPSKASTSGSTYDPFPGSGLITRITNDTDPSLKSWTGAECEWIIRYIAKTSDDVTFTVVPDETSLVETFETMPTFSADTSGVQGIYTKWYFVNAPVVQCPDDSTGDGEQLLTFNGTGFITSSTMLTAEELTSIRFTAWNTSTIDATFSLYLSSDNGATWTEYFGSDSTTAATVAPSASGEVCTISLGLENVSFQFRIGLTSANPAGTCYIDDITVVYDGAMLADLEGSGTADDPYQIATVAQWNTIAQRMADESNDYSNRYIVLANDIGCGYNEITPWGYGTSTAFNGNLDGQGYTISDFIAEATSTYYGPIFIKVGADAVISDLTVEGSLTASYTYCGGVAGAVYGTMRNVTSRVDVSGSQNCTSGFAGQMNAGATLEGCVFEGTVSSTGLYTSGLVGTSARGATYIDCGNRGEVYYTGSSATSYTAGLIGYAYYCTLTRCFNEGSVGSSSSDAGGFAGLMAMAASSSTDSVAFVFDGCWNSADISSSFSNAGLVFTGSTTTTMNMTGCYNTGNITSNYSSSKSSAYTAGLVANYFIGSTYTGCYNTGTITSAAPNYAAGLLGYYRATPSESDTTIISGCYNAGDVTTGGKYAAGIVGSAPSYTEIYDCFNVGDITATNYAGGIVALNAANLTRVYSLGTMAGDSYIGGIAGTQSAEGTISQAYFAGEISTDGNSGAIVGTNAYTSGVTDAYYLNSATSECGTALSRAELAKLDLGSGWTAGDDYTYPRLEALADVDYAIAYAAAVIPSGGDSYESITGGFSVGAPDGVVWTASTSAISIEGNKATFTEAYSGTATLTATAGDAVAVTELTCSVTEPGVDGIQATGAESRTVVDERLYTPAGALVAQPAAGTSKSVYIVVRTYDDGTTATVKEVR